MYSYVFRGAVRLRDAGQPSEPDLVNTSVGKNI